MSFLELSELTFNGRVGKVGRVFLGAERMFTFAF